MNYFEVLEPYYALIKAKNGEDATRKYIEVVAGDESDFDTIHEDCNLVPEYYASARFAQSKDEDGKLTSLELIKEIFESEENQVLLIDGSLL